MSDFIEDFYYGNIEPQECTTNLTAKVKKSLSELADKEEQLTSLLADKDKELFTDYVATYIKFSSLCNADLCRMSRNLTEQPPCIRYYRTQGGCFFACY